MWEANGQELEVAMYVRSVVAAEKPKAPAAARTLVVRQQEALGISLPGLLRNRWIIADVAAPAAGRTASAASSPASIKERMKQVVGG